MGTASIDSRQNLKEYIASHISGGDYDIHFEEKTTIYEPQELMTTINYLVGFLAEQENVKKQLAGDIAHEIRTPLSIISTYLEAMIEGVWELNIERIQSCYEEIGRLSTLVSDIELLAQLEKSKNFKLCKSSIDLMEIVRTGIECFKIDAYKKDITFTLEGTPVVVYADSTMLKLVINKLLSNAIKYTQEHGNIGLLVTTSETNGFLSVEDDGIGIHEQELPLIWERFYRIDKSRSRKTGGTGISLAIVKAIIKAHNGTIDVKSCVDHGSLFTVSIPI